MNILLGIALTFTTAAGVEAQETADLPRELSFQETPEERLRRIEDQLKRQQDKIDEQKKKIDDLEHPKARKGSGLTASFTDGFHINDDEGNFDMHLGGRVILHYRDVVGVPHSFTTPAGAAPPYFARTQPDTFYINSIYLISEGTIYKDWGYRVTAEVTTTTAGPTARPETTYVEWKKYQEFSIRAGNLKSTISIDTISSPLFLDEIERSVLALFVPNFELGAYAYGSFADSLFTYQIGVSNGRSYLAGQGRARNDDDNAKEGIGRITLAPFVGYDGNIFRNLRFGLSGSVGSATAVPMQGNFNLASTELGVTWLIPTLGSFLNGRRIRTDAELSWFYGSASFRMEGLYRSDEVTRAGVDERLLIKAWYAQAGYILTGEDKTLDARIRPAHNFDPSEGHWGALELVSRVALGSAERGTLLALATDLTNNTNRMGSVTVGMNWWTTQNVRISLDGIREQYYGGVLFQPTNVRESHLYGILARFQVDF
jgi:phosphate-selective porin